MTAVAPVAETRWVRMDSLKRRTDVNHRKGRNEQRIAEYVRMLENGETPPPIEVDRATSIIVNGHHRYEGRVRRYNQLDTDPKDRLIEIVYVDGLPDPDKAPVLFALETAAANRHNGEPLDPDEVMKLLRMCVVQHGKEVAKRYARLVNQTPATVERIYRMVTPDPLPAPITTVRLAAEPGQAAKVETRQVSDAELAAARQPVPPPSLEIETSRPNPAAHSAPGAPKPPEARPAPEPAVETGHLPAAWTPPAPEARSVASPENAARYNRAITEMCRGLIRHLKAVSGAELTAGTRGALVDLLRVAQSKL